MTIHSSNLAWGIPWTEEPGRLQSMGVAKYLFYYFKLNFKWIGEVNICKKIYIYNINICKYVYKYTNVLFSGAFFCLWDSILSITYVLSKQRKLWKERRVKRKLREETAELVLPPPPPPFLPVVENCRGLKQTYFWEIWETFENLLGLRDSWWLCQIFLALHINLVSTQPPLPSPSLGVSLHTGVLSVQPFPAPFLFSLSKCFLS